MNIYFQGIWRMDWGLDNPNKTAALIALLMIAVWVLPIIRRWLFWVTLPIFTALGICLMHTMSRGGFLAAFAGLAVLIAALPRPWPRGKMWAVALAIMVILSGAVTLQMTARFAQSPEDRSISNRLKIWKSTPQMMVDAPSGWGLGKSGIAYCSWYQSLAENERYRTLVNSHLTWLVEFGWPLRFFYLFAWASAFVLCFDPAQRKKAGNSGKIAEKSAENRVGFGIAFGLCLAFLIASFFSSVAEVPWLWSLPVLGLCAVIVARWWQKTWPSRWAWGCGLGGTILMLAIFYTLGRVAPTRFAIDKRIDTQTNAPTAPSANLSTGSPMTISSPCLSVDKNGTIRVGASPDLWILISPISDTPTVSLRYPRDFRAYCQTIGRVPVVGFASSVNGLPDLREKRLAVLGPLPQEEWEALHQKLSGCEKLLLLAPNIQSQTANLPASLRSKIHVIFGEFSTQPNATTWKNTPGYQQADGVGDFFRDWPEIVFSALE